MPPSGSTDVGPAPARGTAAAAPEQQPTAGGDRKVARTAALTVVSADIGKAAAGLRALAKAQGGYVASEDLVSPESEPQAPVVSTVVLAIPSDRLEAVLDDIGRIARVTSRSVSSEDVTNEVVDVEARIRTLRDSIVRVRALMDKAGSVSEIAQVESELTRRQGDLESLLAQQKALAQRVATSPVTVTIRPPGLIEENALLGGLRAGWEALLASVSTLLVILGAVLPFALVAAAVGLPLRAWLRRRRSGLATGRGRQPSAPAHEDVAPPS